MAGPTPVHACILWLTYAECHFMIEYGNKIILDEDHVMASLAACQAGHWTYDNSLTLTGACLS